MTNMNAITQLTTTTTGGRTPTPTPTLTDRTVHIPRTPYHELGQTGLAHVPEWAKHRSVYRAAGRTLYLVGTDRLDSAEADLAMLARNGWQVVVDRDGDAANITLSRAAA